jgi:hypothetical protein
MKQYEWIWVPKEKGEASDCFDPSGDPIEYKSDVVVLTPDELWEIWAEAAQKQVDSETRTKNIEMFNNYFKSKGISL